METQRCEERLSVGFVVLMIKMELYGGKHAVTFR